MMKLKNYVLIHGAWHGSWCFEKFAPLLAEKTNSNVYISDLPGHYNNQADFKNVTLDSYVDSVANFIESNIDGKTILVGHSMGGVVISQVAERLSSKISHLVYISGFIPDKNGSLVEERQKAKFPSVSLKAKIDDANYSMSLDHDSCIEFFYNNCRLEDIEFALKHLQKQPLLPFVSNVSLGEGFDNTPKTYIECLQDKAIHIEDQRRMNRVCDNVFSINTDHSPFFSAPEELMEILESIE